MLLPVEVSTLPAILDACNFNSLKYLSCPFVFANSSLCLASSSNGKASNSSCLFFSISALASVETGVDGVDDG